jgi:hypothetical protein
MTRYDTIAFKLMKRAGNFNYLIDQGLSSLPEGQIPDEMPNPPHTLECNSVRQQLQQQKWPGLEIAVPHVQVMDGPNDPQCQLENDYGQWELNGGRVPLIAPPFNQRGRRLCET